MEWNDLPINKKAQLIRLGVKEGLTNLSDIRSAYAQAIKNRDDTVLDSNKLDAGGWIKRQAKRVLGKMEEVSESVWETVKEIDTVTYPYTKYMGANLLRTGYNALEDYYKKEDENNKKSLQVGSIIERDGNYYRVNSDMTETKAEKKEDGNYYWTNNLGKLMVTKSQFKQLEEDKDAIDAARHIGREMQEQRLSQYKNLSKEEMTALQQELVDEGYYTQILNSKSKSEIKKIQRGLGVKVDGILGPITTQAFNESQVDGKYGNNTKKALAIKYNSNGSGEVKAGLDGCAQFVTASFESNNGLTSKQNGVIGDAWTMPFNIVDKGGEMKYNLYEDSRFNNVKDVTSLKNATLKAAKDNPLDYSTIQLGDVVGIYMPSSDMHEVALKNGTTKNTHVGYVVGFDEDGMPLVSHNIHTSYRVDRADKLTGSKTTRAFITTVTSPRSLSANIPEFQFSSKKSRFQIDNGIGKDFQKVLDGMEGASDIFQRMFPNISVHDAMISAIAVQQRETSMGRSRTSDQIEEDYGLNINNIKNIARTAVRKVKGEGIDTKSSNQMKMKLSSLKPYEQRMLGIKGPEDMENPQKAGIAALYIMCKNMNYFTRLKEKYPELKLTDDDIESLTMLSYNQGMSRLANIGFDKNTGTASPKEIEAIRAMAKEGERVRDWTSTNWRHAGIAGRAVYGLIGQVSDNSSVPYIAAAKTAKKKIHEGTGIDNYVKEVSNSPWYDYLLFGPVTKGIAHGIYSANHTD